MVQAAGKWPWGKASGSRHPSLGRVWICSDTVEAPEPGVSLNGRGDDLKPTETRFTMLASDRPGQLNEVLPKSRIKGGR